MAAKKRILWISEASYLKTGFSKLSKEILQRLFDTGKYEIAELGCYAKSSDDATFFVPWKFYGGIPEEGNKLANDIYSHVHTGQFGEAVFEQVCLDFKQDYTISSRDIWMCEFENRSPFRKYFKWIYMPTIDSEPSAPSWLELYGKADLLLAYEDYGKKLIEKECSNKLKVFDVVRPGVNPDIFKPMDKAFLKKACGLNPDSNILMTVMRNQRRKLFPDLMEIFRDFQKKCIKENASVGKNTYLYLHTSYPDVGFDIAKHILLNGIGHQTLVTYVCGKCHCWFPDFFQGELTTCKHCHERAAHMPHTAAGVTDEQLAEIYNLADLYVQISLAESLALPICEAKACGVPALAVDYAAMGPQVKVEGCGKIKVGKFFHEGVTETEQIRALPDAEDAVYKLWEFFTTNKEERVRWGEIARKDAIDNYSFDRAAKIFEKAIDSLDCLDHKTTWLNPEMNRAPLNMNAPNDVTNGEFIDWCIDNVAGQPALKDSYFRDDLVKNLNVGFSIDRSGRYSFDRETALKQFKNLGEKQNFWERARIASFTPKDPNNFKWSVI